MSIWGVYCIPHFQTCPNIILLVLHPIIYRSKLLIPKSTMKAWRKHHEKSWKLLPKNVIIKLYQIWNTMKFHITPLFHVVSGCWHKRLVPAVSNRPVPSPLKSIRHNPYQTDHSTHSTTVWNPRIENHHQIIAHLLLSNHHENTS